MKLVVAAALLAPLPVQAQTTTPAFTDIEADIRARCDAGSFSGTVIVMRGKEALLHVRCQPPGSPGIAADARFKFFSMSKMFTGAAIARLVESGKIDPTTRLRVYFPHLPPAWRDVQVRELLTHSSGIPDLSERLIPEFEQPDTDHHTALDRLLGKLEGENPPLVFEPGTRFAYNNFGYELLAQIGAAAARKPFDKVLHELVLDPAGMRDTVVAMPRYAAGRLDGSRSIERLVPGFNGAPGTLEPAESYSFVQLGAGALIGSADDLVAYANTLHGNRLLSAALQTRIAGEAYPVRAGVSYGYGVMYRQIAGCTIVQHSGGSNGYVSDFARIPARDETVIVLSNFGFAKAEELRMKMIERLTAANPCIPEPTKES